MVAPLAASADTDTVPLGLMLKPAGAPTSDSATLAGAGGLTPLRVSLPSTLAVVPPGAIAPKLSLLASSAPLLMFNVTVAVPHTVVFGAGRQAW